MQYEVEVKCLLGEGQARGLPEKIRDTGITVEQYAQYKQLNDYFIGGNMDRLAENLRGLLGKANTDELSEVARNYDTFSVRARQSGDKVTFIVKATNGGSANHGAQRREFEVAVNVSLEELHKPILASGYKIQARWMADRKLYKLGNGIALDSYFSPGYGYQAEFEKIVHDKKRASEAETEVRNFVQSIGLEPIDPSRIERMFDYYNAHWHEYYGTDKTFRID